MKITYPIRNNFIRLLLILITGLAGSCLAQDYPTRPIKMVMPFAPGGAGDFIGRILSAKMSEVLGQQVFIENKPGLGGNVGLTLGAKSPPDGYTIVYANIGAVAINPALYTNLNINPLKDFTPITNN